MGKEKSVKEQILLKNKGSIKIENELEIDYEPKGSIDDMYSLISPLSSNEERMKALSKYIEIKKFYFNTSKTLSNELEILFSLKGTKNLLKKELTEPIRKDLVFTIGVVPIVFVTEYQPVFKLDGSLALEITLFKHTYSNKSNHGFLYENKNFKLISETETPKDEFNGLFKDPCGSVVTGLDFDAYINHSVKLGLYGFYFFEMDLKLPELNLRIDTNKLSVTGGLEGSSKFILGTAFGLEEFFGKENFGEKEMPFKLEKKSTLYENEWSKICNINSSSSSNTGVSNSQSKQTESNQVGSAIIVDEKTNTQSSNTQSVPSSVNGSAGGNNKAPSGR